MRRGGACLLSEAADACCAPRWQVAKKWNITREEMEKLSIESHRRAFEATKNGYFEREVVKVKGA